MDNFQIQEVVSKSDLNDFIFLPAALHKFHANWVPPIYHDEKNYYKPAKNLAFRYCDTRLLLARVNGKPAGRIMGIINHRHNTATGSRTGRFSFFECIDDKTISGALLENIEEWCRSRGMDRIIGPFGMYYHDPIGFMTYGFGEKPSTSANYNFDYMVSLMEASGYGSENDLVVYKIDIPGDFPSVYHRVLQNLTREGNAEVMKLKTKADLRKYISPVLGVMNECFREIYGYADLDDEEMKFLASHFIPLLDPEFVAVVKVNGEIAGFTIAIPSLNEGIISAKGRIFPFGFLKIIRSARTTRQLDLLIGDVREKYRGKGIDVLISKHLIETARNRGFTSIDSHLELESNYRIRSEMVRVGGRVIKKYRVFSKSLN